MSTGDLTGSASPADAGGVLSPTYRWISIGMCSLILLAAFESLAVTTVMPGVSAELGGQSLYALAFAGPLAVSVVGMVLAGNWSDRRGPRGALLAAVLLFAIGLIVAGTAQSMGVLVAGRLIHGFGGGGLTVAQFAQVFGMRVIAWSENLTPERAAQCGVTWVSKQALFEQADILTVHLVLSERSRGLVDAQALSWMKPSARLVNTARGPIVDEQALVAALESGRLAGAALDVFTQEPLPVDHLLRRLPNVLAAPHVGYVSEQNYRQFYQQMIEDIQAWAKGAPIRVLA